MGCLEGRRWQQAGFGTLRVPKSQFPLSMLPGKTRAGGAPLEVGIEPEQG